MTCEKCGRSCSGETTRPCYCHWQAQRGRGNGATVVPDLPRDEAPSRPEGGWGWLGSLS